MLDVALTLLLLSAASASAATRYVWQDSPNPAPPYTNWTTAAHVLQDAVDAALAGDEIVVANGTFATGGRAVGTNVLANRVAVDKPLTLRSVNGPQYTVIQGYQVPGTTNGDGAIRCVYLTNGASLSGFTLTNGATRTNGDYYLEQSGGGVWCYSTNAVVSNCVFAGNSASMGGGAYSGTLNNCTLTYNSASSGGGAYSGTLINCTLTGNSASRGGGARGGTLNHCTLTGNSALYGGGAYGGTLNHCTLTGNSAYYGGGASGSTLNHCTLTSNSASGGGGGASSGWFVATTLNYCTLIGNSARCGGGADGGTLNHCTLNGNSASDGGGAYESTLNNCALTGNTALSDYYGDAGYGGGVYSGTLNNCTLSGNWATYGGGAYGGTLNNCIVYFNTAANEPNYSESFLNYCCTTPLPASSTGNITANPELASASHLSFFSPCRGAGSADYSSGVDIDGEAWATPPSIGCDEYHAGADTGPLSVDIAPAWTNAAVGFPVALTALIEGQTTLSIWDFGDGTLALDQPYATHAWTAPGDYLVSLWALNDSHPAGVSANVTIHVLAQPVHYAAADSAHPLPPYTSWATAATNIQDAVDAAAVGGTVLVTNGIYATGARAVYGVSHRLCVSKPLTVRSVHGPQFTVVDGGGAVSCVYLVNGTFLAGLTLTNGNGRGVACESVSATVSNCVITGNTGGGTSGGTLNKCLLTGNSAGQGGGAYFGTLNNCALIGNSATYGGGAYAGMLNNCTLTGNSALSEHDTSGGYGGGAHGSTLNNCTLTGNSALSSHYGNGGYGGGASGSTLNNCIVYFNTAPKGPNYDSSTLNYCCTTPLPASGTGNLIGDPELASTSHLNVFSGCRGAGSAAYTSGVDIDGEAWATPPSIGCDEYDAGAVTGPLSVDIAAAYTTVAVGYAVALTARIEGRTALSIWEFGDGALSFDQPYETHAWTTPGDYVVSLWAYNESHPEGVNATVTIHVVQGFHYVAADGAHPVSPYTSWATAAKNIQEAVDAAIVGGTVLVTNGTYSAGGRAVHGTMTNRVAVIRPLTVRSVSGPQFTVIRGQQVAWTNGDGAIRCAYLTNGASLSGFTLTNGATRKVLDYPMRDTESSGGGVWCESTDVVVSNCVLAGNSAYFQGGGAYGGTLNDCTLRGNAACNGGGAWGGRLNNCMLSGNSVLGSYVGSGCGGGAYYNTLSNCTLTGNSASGSGGGAYYAILINCLVTNNSAKEYGGGAYAGTLDGCTLIGNVARDNYNGDGGYGGGAYGSTLNNCTLTDNAAFTERYNGIGGGGGGAYGSTLTNCTLNGNRAGSGGGANSSKLANCTLSGNRAGGGGGAADSTLNNCALTSNSACYGGGASLGTLNNCTLTGNSATNAGGGAYRGTLNNCIVYFNTATNGPNFYQDEYGGLLNHCCTTAMPTNGVGNITNAPLFIDYAGGNLCLQSNSPCINAGNNAFVTTPTDLDGLPRIVSGMVDIGAYEFQGPGSVISYAWLQHFGLPTDGSADTTDPDADGLNTWQEWRCLTDPTNALSALRLLTSESDGTNVTVSWQSVAGVNYFLERSTNLWASPPFTPLATGIPGQPGTTTYTDTNAAPLAPLFYRVGVSE
jgi:hypothetical protein